MKKRGILFACLMLVVAMLVSFCGCSAYGGVKSAFEKEGYEEVEPTEDMKKLYENNEDLKAAKDVVTLHVLQKKATGDSLLGDLANALTIAVILEFNTNEEMEEALKNHVTKEDAENVYEELQKLDTVSGNCFLVFYTPASDGGKIFKSTK